MSLAMPIELPAANEVVSVGQLRELSRQLEAANQELSKSLDAGYPTPQTGGGAMGPLTLQSIEHRIADLDPVERDITFFKEMQRVPVFSTTHEVPRALRHGNPQFQPFVGEGKSPAYVGGKYDKLSFKVKYLARLGRLTDVVRQVRMLGNEAVPMVGLKALDNETNDQTIGLREQIEIALIWADSSKNALAFDGLLTQILNYNKAQTDSGKKNVADCRDKELSPQLLSDFIARQVEGPFRAVPDVIKVTPGGYADLIRYATQFGRHDQLQQNNADAQQRGFFFGPQGSIFITAPTIKGGVPVEVAPYMERWYESPTVQSSLQEVSTDHKNPPVIALEGAPSAVVDAASLFTADDAGDYIFRFVGYNDVDGSYGAKLDTVAITLAAGQKARVDIANADGFANRFKVFRSTKNGDATTLKYLGDFARNTDGANGTSRFEDLNKDIPGRAPVLFWSKQYTALYQLLDFIRRPLSDAGQPIMQFLLMLFATMGVSGPDKQGLLWNVKTSTGGSGELNGVKFV